MGSSSTKLRHTYFSGNASKYLSTALSERKKGFCRPPSTPRAIQARMTGSLVNGSGEFAVLTLHNSPSRFLVCSFYRGRTSAHFLLIIACCKKRNDRLQ